MINDPPREELLRLAVEKEGLATTEGGALVVITGACTGRSPNAKFIVKDDKTIGTIDWENNQSCSPHEWIRILNAARRFEYSCTDICVQSLYAGRDESHQLGLTVKTSAAWQALFANNMFVRSRASSEEIEGGTWELLCFPEMQSTPRVYINFTWQKIIITGTHYAGEIKKSIFTVLNYLLPEKGILPMHCSVNTTISGKGSAIFFGLSGTGKTTLSASYDRILIGDDEHGWSSSGLFNFEGGCYAKLIDLRKDDEPQIWEAIHREGAILENVVVENGIPLFDRHDLTQNTRGSYPIEHISNASLIGKCDHPTNIIFLTCDAFGVLPPVAKLSISEAVDHFLMGYTAKVAGTEEGVSEPQMTFSHCYGAPFMPRAAMTYGKLLRTKLETHGAECWLVNTGWTGGPYGIGKRIPISVTRDIIETIHNGSINQAIFKFHRPTSLMIPARLNHITEDILTPEKSWKDQEAYASYARQLMGEFKKELGRYQR